MRRSSYAIDLMADFSFLFLTATKRCALCKELRSKKDLLELDGHLLCASCARLVREEGFVLPPNLGIDCKGKPGS